MSIDSVLIAGCGYIGTKVAALEQQTGIAVSAILRDPNKAANLAAQSIEAITANLDTFTDANLSLRGKGIYYFAPPPEKGVQDTRIDNFLAQISDAQMPAKILLISTTGVYGNCEGNWIDENTPVNPQADRAKRRVDAENRLRSWCELRQVPYIILRVPGIYAPDRLPEERIRNGLPVLLESESPWSNRIHADDLVNICVRAMHSDLANRTYNVSDGNPSTMTDYFNHVADFLHLPRPPQISLQQAQSEMSAGMLSYLAESKRIKPDQLTRELGYQMRYPTLKQGLTK